MMKKILNQRYDNIVAKRGNFTKYFSHYSLSINSILVILFFFHKYSSILMRAIFCVERRLYLYERFSKTRKDPRVYE